MIPFNTLEEGKYFITDIKNREVVYDSLIEDIKDGLIFDLKIITIYTYEKEGVHHYLYMDQWVPSLKNALKFYESLEKYEVCIEIRDLISVLEDVFI